MRDEQPFVEISGDDASLEHDNSTPYESVRDLDAAEHRLVWSYLDVHDRPTFIPT